METNQIFEYVKFVNRPFSLNDVNNKFHKDIKKSVVIRCIDELLKANKIVEKVYGKQKVYYVNQSIYEKLNDEQFIELERCVQNLMEEDKILSNKLAIIILSEKLKKLKDTYKDPIDNNLLDKLLKKKKDYNKICSQRKRIVSEIVAVIEENTGKSKKDIIRDVGLN
ncbi:PSMC3-interacting protein [Intoshia linei]|uniref:PSMC3-interacting protein n=1 Tax=Intoshia linei TaxID=1819745 RepID=A0A177BC94_9BILA|nr:PSMC3-interacting protein [Intoshia linei]